ncbi:MAG: glycoside hydrolase family 5 protein [Lachnospiraceae bacterium]|nr:glycoside hydrolase family 5 protein [Lachnospiraceae bacterium]
MKRFRGILAEFFLAVCVLAAVFIPKRYSGASAVSANGQLSVKGTQIVNEKGKAFVIKGVSTHGLSWFPQYANKKAFQTLKKKGVNTIRLAMYTEEYNGYCNSGTENQKKLKSLISKGVKAASELGMYVIIDWHILSDGNPLTHKAEAKKFFKTMAKKYNGKKNVFFEICNEPNGAGDWSSIKKYANAVIKTIRSVNKKAVIIVGTPTWSQDVDTAAASPLKGSNLVYALHFYAATHGQYLRDKYELAIKKGLPVLVTEFGISDASGNGNLSKSEGNKWMKLLNKYKAGRVCWNLSNKAETSSLLKSSCQKTGGWKSSDYTAQAKWLWKWYK